MNAIEIQEKLGRIHETIFRLSEQLEAHCEAAKQPDGEVARVLALQSIFNVSTRLKSNCVEAMRLKGIKS